MKIKQFLADTLPAVGAFGFLAVLLASLLFAVSVWIVAVLMFVLEVMKV